MSEKRDPRVDPKPGDVLKQAAKFGHRRVVTRRVESHGRIWISYKFATREISIALELWRHWAKTAEVIHAAE